MGAVFPVMSRRIRGREILPALAMLLLALAAYYPALRGDFIWDDDYNVTKSAVLHSFAGLERIWLEPGATQQYYPLTHTSFWLDYHLWGLHPAPYHLENVLLHAAAAIGLWRLLRRLQVPGAWLGAALFALHPVAVESVAWITERKNTLSGVFCLASAAMAVEFWLPRATPTQAAAQKAQRGDEFGRWQFYWLALVFYLCALWSKTATIGLPGVILLLAWWKRGRLIRRDALLLLPFVICGLLMACITIIVENHLIAIGGSFAEWKFSPLERLLIGSRAIWFYLGKIVWPHPLMFIYPRWNIQTSQPLAYVPLAMLILAFAWLWHQRQGWGRPVLVALGCMVAMLFPVLGAFNVFFFLYSFVCDHFQYLAMIGPLALAGAGITRGVEAVFPNQRPAKLVAGGVLLLTLAVLTWRQTGIFKDRESLWRDSVAQNPDSWMAHDNLGIYFSQTGRFQEANGQYQAAIKLRPNDHLAYYDLGLQAAIQGDLAAAIQCFGQALKLCPTYALAHYDLGNIFSRQGKFDDAIREYALALETYPDLALAHYNLGNALAKQARPDEALREYEKVVELQPAFAPAQAAAGRLLAAQGKGDEAINHFQAALAIDPGSLEAMVNLANALLGKGRFDEAIGFYRSALELQPNSAVIHYNLGVALTRHGSLVEAQRELDLAKKLQAQPSQ